MSGIVVVYEIDEPAAAHGSGGASAGGDATVLRVHAAPAAPGMTVPGPRTFCGRDTFAMRTAPWQPAGQPGSGEPGSAWCAPEYADRLCPACDDAVGGG